MARTLPASANRQYTHILGKVQSLIVYITLGVRMCDFTYETDTYIDLSNRVIKLDTTYPLYSISSIHEEHIIFLCPLLKV